VPIALVSNAAAAGLNSGTTSAINTTGATLLVCVAAFNSAASVTISDSKSNTWTALTLQDPGGGLTVAGLIYYVANPTVGTGHTFTITATGNAPAGAFMAFSGVTTASPFDVQNGANTNGSVTSLATGSVTPGQNNELVVSGLGLGAANTPSESASFTLVDHLSFVGGTSYGVDSSYKVQTTAAAVNPTWSWASATNAAAMIATFKQSPALASGTASFTSVTNTTINLSVGTATGGTAPYTYQWYRSTTANFTPGGGNLLSGATSTTLADSASLVFGTSYYYICVVTDNVSATAQSNQVAGTLLATPLIIGFLGDSITKGTAGPNPAAVTFPTRCGTELQKLYQQRAVTISNQGVDGSSAMSWAADTGSIFTNAKTAFASAGCTHIFILLGANDAASANLRTAAQFSTDLQTIIGPGAGSLVTAGYKVVLNYPTYIPSGANGVATNQQSTELTRQYLAKIDALIDNVNVLQGDKLAYQYFMDHQSETQTDNTHLLDAGNISLASMQARAFDRSVLNPTIVSHGLIAGQAGSSASY
jgi:lysophospholipase L1-like esterase